MHSFTVKAFVASAVLAQLALAGNQRLPQRFFRRQAFDPDETTQSGANCVDAFGEGYVECRAESALQNRLCINPDLGETCCENEWGCPADSFCLVQDLCCPTGLDPDSCAAQNNVNLPPGFEVETAAPLEPSATPSPDADTTSIDAPIPTSFDPEDFPSITLPSFSMPTFPSISIPDITIPGFTMPSDFTPTVFAGGPDPTDAPIQVSTDAAVVNKVGFGAAVGVAGLVVGAIL